MSNQLAVLHQPSNEVLPSPQQWQTMLQMAETLVKSGFLPKAIDTPAKATAVILKGREIGIPAMQSFAHINVIDGKPTCSAELQLALLGRGGVTWDWLEDGTTGTASIRFHRPGFEPFISTFTTEDAKTAGLLGKQSWQKYPASMRCARAISNGARKIGPDLIAGMSYTPEELGAETDDEGYVLEIRQPVKPVTKALERPAMVKTPAGESVINTSTGEIVDPEPPGDATDDFEGTPPAAELDPTEQAERAAVIREIERLEGVFAFTIRQKNAMRTRDMGCADFDQASFDSLKQYCDRMETAVKTGGKK